MPSRFPTKRQRLLVHASNHPPPPPPTPPPQLLHSRHLDFRRTDHDGIIRVNHAPPPLPPSPPAPYRFPTRSPQQLHTRKSLPAAASTAAPATLTPHTSSYKITTISSVRVVAPCPYRPRRHPPHATSISYKVTPIVLYEYIPAATGAAAAALTPSLFRSNRQSHLRTWYEKSSRTPAAAAAAAAATTPTASQLPHA